MDQAIDKSLYGPSVIKESIRLPGYGAQPNESGVLHSQRKLQTAAEELKPYLTVGRTIGGDDYDSSTTIIQSIPCHDEASTWGYRCKTSFQILLQHPSENNHPDDNTPSKRHPTFQYAMRQQKEAIPLGSSVFPIANRRIQMAMAGFMDRVLNQPSDDDGGGDSDVPRNDLQQQQQIPPPFHLLKRNLVSITFCASWNDEDWEEMMNEEHIDTSRTNLLSSSDCIVTLNYDSPLHPENDRATWCHQAQQVCRMLQWTQLHGRSRKVHFSAFDPTKNVLKDTVWLLPVRQNNNTDTSKVQSICRYSVSCVTQPPSSSMKEAIPVLYEKPDDAFYHPNVRAMCHALEWILQRLSTIVASTTTATPCHLLEMYSGCGAHTMAIAKANIVDSIVAVELDQRLVKACLANLNLNLDNSNNAAMIPMTPVHVLQGDAAHYAKEWSKKNHHDEDNNKSISWLKEDKLDFHPNILLVDPPRMGLDPVVIEMTIHGPFQHVLIISCGHSALVRDLKLLSEQHFQVESCTQLDLFPRTDYSIETLVHLVRRSSST